MTPEEADAILRNARRRLCAILVELSMVPLYLCAKDADLAIRRAIGDIERRIADGPDPLPSSGSSPIENPPA